MKVKENECKEKRIYDLCAFKEKNIDATWGVVGESKHDGVHHHIRPQHSVNDTRHDPDPPCQRASSLRDRQRQMLPWLAGAVLRVPLRLHPIDAPRAQMVFLEEMDHQREGRVTNLRTRSWKLSCGREDEGYKGNIQIFWKVLLSRRKFQFLTF